jgi:hypothetical protein
MLWVSSTTNLGRTKRPKAADNGVAMNSCEFAEIGRFRSTQPGASGAAQTECVARAVVVTPGTGGRQTTNLEERLVARLAAPLAAFG